MLDDDVCDLEIGSLGLNSYSWLVDVMLNVDTTPHYLDFISSPAKLLCFKPRMVDPVLGQDPKRCLRKSWMYKQE